MAQSVVQVGWRANQVAGATTPVSINAATPLVLPTTAQRLRGNTMMVIINVENQAARWTVNGVTPTAAIGMLIQPNSPLTLTGELSNLASFQIIGTVAGATITYQFFTADDRG